jgi:hypothetical protein
MNKGEDMKVDIYKSTETSDCYFVVPSGSDINNLPERVELSPEKIDINSGENRIGLSADNAISDISSKGYHITRPCIEVTEDNAKQLGE